MSHQAPNVYYVDGCSDNIGSNTGTLTNPWRTIQTAAFNLRAGQTVLVRNRADCPSPTVYRTTPNATSGAHGFAVVAIGNDAGQDQFADGGVRSGTPTAWITYRNYPGERPLIRTTKAGVNPSNGGFASGNFHGFSVRNASYIIIDGFEIEGHLSDVTLQEATDLNRLYQTDRNAPITSALDSSGITVGNGGQSPARAREIPHHVIVRNNIVRDHPGGGINALFADWVTIEYNTVNNVASYSPYGASALNIFRAKDVDNDTTSYKMIIRGNTASGAQNLFPCQCAGYNKATDGNGLILDQLSQPNTEVVTTPIGSGSSQIPPGTYTLPAYAGRTLVTNNIVTRNGGRGIHVFQSQNADVAFNTAVENSQIANTATSSTGDGEITSQQSLNVRVANNIMVARPDRPAYWINFANAAAKARDEASVVFDRNIIFGGNPAAPQVQVTSTNSALRANNRFNDPRFSSTTGRQAFSLLSGSPAIDTAFTLDWPSFTTPLVDRYLAPRPRGAAADIGAVESF
jgi:parallel beta-helix repeat protein